MTVTQIKDWLVRRDDGVFDIYVDIIYPRMLQAMIEYGKKLKPETAAPGSGRALLIEAAKIDVANLDQYWLECIYQMTKLEAQRLIFRTELDTRTSETPALVFHFRTAAKTRWRHHGKPPGRGVSAATGGKEARTMFEELRGAIPR